MTKTQEKQVIPSTVALHLLTDVQPIIPEHGWWLLERGVWRGPVRVPV